MASVICQKLESRLKSCHTVSHSSVAANSSTCASCVITAPNSCAQDQEHRSQTTAAFRLDLLSLKVSRWLSRSCWCYFSKVLCSLTDCHMQKRWCLGTSIAHPLVGMLKVFREILKEFLQHLVWAPKVRVMIHSTSTHWQGYWNEGVWGGS